MDYVSCQIAIGGDPANVMYKGPDDPVSWPEIRVLQHLHGDDNVFDCVFVRTDDSTTQAEKMRLLGKYGSEPIGICYPGSRPMMEMDFPGDKEPALTVPRPVRHLIKEPELPLEPPTVELGIPTTAAERAKRSHHKRQPEEV